MYLRGLEAPQNILNCGRASHAVVRLEETDSALEFSVADNGAGFDPETTPHGACPANMAHRLEAFGRTLEVWSRPGEETVIAGRIPAYRTLIHIGRR